MLWRYWSLRLLAVGGALSAAEPQTKPALPGGIAGQPAGQRQPILFVARPRYRADHHNTETMFQTGEICTASFQGGERSKCRLRSRPQVKTLLELPEGVARDLDVRFDGQRILFSMRRNIEDDYHLYEMNADGSDLKQLTFGAGLTDIDPIYLPDGRILFTSTREPKYCMCNRHIMGNLFTMDADGANLQQIGHSTLHEGHASLLPDGRVIYDRWEYVDRNFGDAQGVWVTNPDERTTRSIGATTRIARCRARRPGHSRHRAVHRQFLVLSRSSLGGPGHRRKAAGRGRSRTGRADLAGGGNQVGGARGLRHVHMSQPEVRRPLSSLGRYFLCSRMTGQQEQMGIYLLDLDLAMKSCYTPTSRGALIRCRWRLVPDRR